jgi:hypothetical protein
MRTYTWNDLEAELHARGMTDRVHTEFGRLREGARRTLDSRISEHEMVSLVARASPWLSRTILHIGQEWYGPATMRDAR